MRRLLFALVTVSIASAFPVTSDAQFGDFGTPNARATTVKSSKSNTSDRTTTVKSSKSNTSDRVGNIPANPFNSTDRATTVKSSKSNTSDRTGGPGSGRGLSGY